MYRLRVFLFVLLFSLVARAETLEAPIGGRAIRVGEGRVVCKGTPLEAGWTSDPDGKTLLPPAAPDAVGKVVAVKVAAAQGACATSSSELSVVALGPRPTVDTLTVDIDGGRIVAQGHRLRGAVLRWSTHGRSGSDVCAAPQVVAGADTCVFSAPRDLPADTSLVRVEVFPPGTSLAPDMGLHDAGGARLPEGSFEVRGFDVSVQKIVPPDASVDMSSGTGHVALAHPEAVAQVSCVDAACSLEGGDLVVRAERGSDDQLDVHLQLRAHVTLRTNGPPDAAPVVIIPLQRCPVSIASAAVVSGADDPRVVLKVEGTCARAQSEQLSVETEEGPGRIERTELVGGALYAVVRVPRVGDAIVVTVRRRGTVLGTARAAAHRLVWRTRLELEGYGDIDFIPTNRWAKVMVPAAPHGTAVEVRPVEGIYETRRDESGASFVRGTEGASGSVSLRLGLVDRSLPASLAGLTLAEASEPVDRAIRVANVPIALGPAALEKDPLVELVCGDSEGHVRRMRPGGTSSIPYRARDTCQLVFHRERLRAEDGAQKVRVTVNVTGSDGLAHADARVDDKLVMRENSKPRTMAIVGATDPFDRLSVRVGNANDDLGDGAGEDEHRPLETQWSVVTGTDHARLYGTAAIPTGLFRVSDSADSGILTLNAGALLRLAALTRDGTAFPLGLEAGVMWLGIAGVATTTTVSPYGEVAAVGGLGVAVPIANATRASQTAISLHAWFEYEVSRAILHQSGSAIGFVFGPSISIGDVGTNF